MLRIGIYGGSFSPVHKGHVRAVKAFMEQMQLDFVYVIPTYVPPHKSTEGVVNAEHRFRMCELAFGDVDGVVISDIEIKRGGKSYTVETLRALHGEDRRLFLLMGTDMMLTLGSWYCADEIFRLCYPVYMRRETDDSLNEQIVAKISQYLNDYGKVVRRIVEEPVEISSTQIREMIREGKDISELVPEKVAAYITEHRLYLEEGDAK